MGDVIGDTTAALTDVEARVIGDGGDAMIDVEVRLRAAFPDAAVVAWEGDAATFQFTYVSPNAEQLLGYPVHRWLTEPTFWADQVVAPEDRNDAVGYCALATAGRRDHVFEYRALTADGRVLVMRDIVVVILGRKGLPARLRGLMFDVTRERGLDITLHDVRARQRPTRAELEGNAAAV